MATPASAATVKPAATDRTFSTPTIVAVLAIYGWIVFARVWEPTVNHPAQQPYNWQTMGFLAGQLSLS
ncbi:MAG: hypothetical protein EXS37_13295, partial [Opitutus sp.]|nr:hypothetical protein [Opitutus sp.]